jgi:hypothetical protein
MHTEYGAAALPVIVGVTQVLKTAFRIEGRYVPLVSLVLGLGTGAVLYRHEGWVHALMEGLILGLAASGLYSGGKALAGS